MKRLLSVIKGLYNHEKSKKRLATIPYQVYSIHAILKFIYAHVLFIIKDEFKFTWIHGIRMKAIKHRAVTTECLYFGKYDYEEMTLIERCLRNDRVLVDVGANIGSYSLLAGSIGGKAIAFEPVESTYEILCDNIFENKLDDTVIPQNICITDYDGNTYFTTSNDTENHISTDRSEDAVEVVCKRLDDVVDSCYMIKIDVEGHEMEVLRGADRLLSSKECRFVIAEAFSNRSQIDEYLRQYGFICVGYDVRKKKLYKVDCKDVEANNVIYYKTGKHS